ncbi:MAG: agmatinase [Candidatus Cloacimonetes bacterium]|nr:agmatinase [Candidatus Cloacimonadota bacterium]
MPNYISFNSSLEEAKIVFLGIPFDGTATFRPGSRFAPDAIRNVSDSLETYSPYQDKDLADYDICDNGDLILPFGNTEKVLQIIEERSTEILQAGNKILACGGEHLISLPLIKAHLKKYPALKVVHFDAHTDLRDEYLGEKYSHSSVIRLLTEYLPPQNIYQFGIRSGEKHEFDWGRNNTKFFPFSLNDFIDKIKDIDLQTPLYVTIDLDILDPAYFPGTGTPEPGGVTFSELLNALLGLMNRNIVGADVVELAPDYDPTGISSITAAKIIREMALLLT